MKKILVISLTFFAFSALTVAQNIKSGTKNILVFSETSRNRHESISSGLKMIFDLSSNENWVVTATEDASLFTPEFLGRFDVVVFLNPTGSAFNEGQKKAFEQFMEKGKGFVGIHSAADFEHEWPWYGKLVGGYFKTHPASQEATIKIEDASHPAMKPFEGGKTYSRFDEWYTFKENPRKNVHVLAALDETSIKKTDNDNWKMGDHPFIWWQENKGSRSFYTGFGHTHEDFQDKVIVEHIRQAINWAAKRL